jgi:hypothetical protein
VRFGFDVVGFVHEDVVWEVGGDVVRVAGARSMALTVVSSTIASVSQYACVVAVEGIEVHLVT